MDLKFPDSYREFYESFPTHDGVPQISVAEVVELQRAGKRVVFVDARMRAEQKVSVIGEAIRVPVEKNALEVTDADCAELLDEAPIRSQLEDIGPDDVVVSYCTAGLRGAFCAVALEKKLGRKAFNLTGGIIEWHNQGHPVNKDGQATEHVHPLLPQLAKYIDGYPK